MARRVTGLAGWKPTEQSLAVVKIASEDLRDEWPLLVRRVLYVAYERGLYPDKGKGSYDAVGNVLGRARRAGLLPWEAVADTAERVYTTPYGGADGFLAAYRYAAENGCLLDRQEGQPGYLIAWSEHRGLKETLADVAGEYGVPFIPAGGFDGHAVRYIEAREAASRPVPTTVLHLSDLDRHGAAITDVLRRDLEAIYCDLGGAASRPLEVVKIALTEAQAAEVYPDRGVLEDIQIDALPTPRLREILREAIIERQDPAVLDSVLDREEAERGQLRALLQESDR
jgi:hypothetical protein